MKTIILASASPRRRELLAKTGLKFKVVTSHYEETITHGLSPRKVAAEFAQGKARQVADSHPEAIVIAADTLVVCRGQLFGKPHTPDEARRMLKKLNGQRHQVVTSFCIMERARQKEHTETVSTSVYLKKLSDCEIDAYVKTGEPLDKAGAYAIQGLGAIIVEKIAGDYANVVGLPLFALAAALRDFGISLLKE